VKIIVSGATGLIGSAVVAQLWADGHSVTRLLRSAPPGGSRDVQWQPQTGSVDSAALEGHDAAIHLAGEPIAQRWNEARKASVRASRVEGTRLLSQTLAQLASPPRVLVSASAIGYYGDRGDEVLREDSPAGTGFLAEVGQEWEDATAPAGAAGMRVVHLRFGLVLTRKGGALAKMLPPFRLGVGGRIGSGQQFWSWITLDDTVGVVLHALNTPAVHGAVNVVSPQPLRNAEFARVLGQALNRPALFPFRLSPFGWPPDEKWLMSFSSPVRALSR
jgi:uncharacterized protein (TIGR01777 family)